MSASIFAFTVTRLPRKRAAAQAVAVVDRICAIARRALRVTAALLGVAAFAAFGGTALKAQTVSFTGAQGMLGSGFNGPSDVAVDSTGNLFVADQGNNAVKEILAAGDYTKVNTLAAANGNFNSPTGVAVDGSGNVFVADLGNSVVKEILAAGGYTTVKTLATNGSFISPTGVAVDATGDVFVADQGANAVKEILAADGYVTVNTLAVTNGNFYEPSNVAVDGSGDVFVADYGNSLVKEILAAGGYTSVHTLGSGFSLPNDVAVDAGGNVYVADSGDATVKEIMAMGGYTTVHTLGSGFTEPYGVAVGGSGTVYVADITDTDIVEVQPDGVNFGAVNVKTASSVLSLTFTFATGGILGSTAVLTQGAAGLDFVNAGTGTCKAGTVYITAATCSIDVTFTPRFPGVILGAAELLASSGNILASTPLAGTGVGPQVTFLPGQSPLLVASGLSVAFGMAVDANGNVFVAESGAGTVDKFTRSESGYSKTTLATGLNVPRDVAVDGSGNVYVAASASVYKLRLSNGVYTPSRVISAHDDLVAIAVDGGGNLYLADRVHSTVYKETLSNGRYAETAIGTDLSGPTDVAVDGKGNVYITNFTSGDVYKETPQTNGSYLQSTVAAAFGSPLSVAVDGGENLYIAVCETGAVYKFALQENGEYTQITLHSGVINLGWATVDRSGNVYASQEAGNSTIAMYDLADPPSLSFASTNVGSTSTDSPQTVTVSNIGNTTLAFPVPELGFNPNVSSEFPLAGSTTCPEISSSGTAGSLAAGNYCVYAINFAPSAGVTFFDSIGLTDTNLNTPGPFYATQSITLRGTGIGPNATRSR